MRLAQIAPAIVMAGIIMAGRGWPQNEVEQRERESGMRPSPIAEQSGRFSGDAASLHEPQIAIADTAKNSAR
jgi:hypothetical protein